MNEEEKKSEEQIIDDILKEQAEEGKEIEDSQKVSQYDKRKQKLDDYQNQTMEKKAAESLKKRKNNLKAAVNRFNQRKLKSRTTFILIFN